MARLATVLSLLALAAGALLLAGPGQPSCVPVEPEEPECRTAADCNGTSPLTCIGAWACVEGSCVWECGPPPQPEDACYTDADCPEAHECVLTNDCCAPPGCEPGMDCPAVCVACGECRLKESECLEDAQCGPGEVCVLETFCLCPPDTDPACLAPCLLVGTCEPRTAACAAACDCYEAGLEFTQVCPMLCPTCDMYWSCTEGLCVERCGPVPPEILPCR